MGGRRLVRPAPVPALHRPRLHGHGDLERERDVLPVGVQHAAGRPERPARTRRTRSSAATTRSRWATSGGSTAAGRSASGTRRRRFRMRLGSYSMTIAIPPRYTAPLRHLGGARADDGGGQGREGAAVLRPGQARRGTRRPVRPRSRRRSPIPTPRRCPTSSPLPSWGISTERQGGRDYLDFGATVWDHGPAPMDIEGFRRLGTNVMDAYEYFYKHGVAVGRARVGTLLYDAEPGHEHWHFQQFVRYSLLELDPLAGRAQPEGRLLPGPDRPDRPRPARRRLEPRPARLPGRMRRPDGHLDARGAAVGVGRHVRADAPRPVLRHHRPAQRHVLHQHRGEPARAIYEVRTGNDTSLRKVILGGTPGKRTVRVPAWHGIDPEG